MQGSGTSASDPCNVGSQALVKVGLCGGAGGSLRDMDDVTSLTRIVQIGIRSGVAIDAITIRFERNGYEESTAVWGGTGGSPTFINFQRTEYITAVRGHAGLLGNFFIVKSLSLETNLCTYGPYGEVNGIPFELTALGGQIIGFYASCSYYVHAIGVYVKALTSIPRNMRSPVIQKIGLCGGAGGTPRDMDVTGVTRIVKIGVRHSQVVDALIVRFKRGGAEENTNLWGGRGGKLTVMSFQPTEYITTVKGYTGFYNDNFVLTSIKFETNLGKIYGPYGTVTENGAPFELSALGGQIVGFHGRSGLWLDAIGIYITATDVPSNIRLHKIGLCGGGGGQVRDMNVTDVHRIVKIDIYHGNAIKALVVHYQRNGCDERTDHWGGEGGEQTTINFRPSEYIKSIKGYVGFGEFLVASLKLETNLGNYGPYGTDIGTPFELAALDGQIIGFHVRSGAFIDAIGVYVKKT